MPITRVVLLVSALLLPLACGGGGGTGGAVGLALPVSAANPFSTLILGSLGLASDQDVTVRFVNDDGYWVEVAAASAEPIEVGVPVYIDPATGSFSGGTVQLEVLTGSGPAEPVPGDLFIHNLGAADNGPNGTLALAFMRGTRDLQDSAEATLGDVEADATVNLPVEPGMRSMLLDNAANLGTWDALVGEIMSGMQPYVPFGILDPGGSAIPLGVDIENLGVADDFVAGFLDQLQVAAALHQPQTPAIAKFALIDRLDLARNFTSLFDDISAESIEFSKKIGKGLAIATAVGAGAALLLGSVPLATAISVVGAVGWMVTTFAPAAIGAFLKLGGRAALDEPGSWTDVMPELKHVAGSMLGAVTGQFADIGISRVAGGGSAAAFGVFDAVYEWTGKVGEFVVDSVDLVVAPPPPPPPPAVDETFRGNFSGSGQFGISPCTFNLSMAGTITIFIPAAGGGTVAVGGGTWNSVPLQGQVGDTMCNPSNGPVGAAGSVPGGPTNPNFTATGAPTVSFVGSRNGNTITGTATFTFPGATGSIVRNVTLTKQ